MNLVRGRSFVVLRLVYKVSSGPRGRQVGHG